MKYKRIFLLIIDSLGIGATKDADEYGDGMANSLLNVLNKNPISLPNFRTLGLFNLFDDTTYKTAGYFAKVKPNHKMKCSVMSHYEMMGSICKNNYQKFNLDCLTKDLKNYIEAEIDRRIILANETDDKEIIKNYGIEHMKTGDIILTYDYYNITIYSHEEVIPLKGLSQLSKIIMENLVSNGFFINKIICKTFIGKPNALVLNKMKHITPFPLKGELVLGKLKKAGFKVITIGKSSKIFDNTEITNVCYTNNDVESVKKLMQAMELKFEGLCITNLSELNYCGHTRNIKSYVKVLKNYDNIIPLVVKKLKKDDLFIITSDQGNDPTFSGNDHTREKLPVLMFSLSNKEYGELPFMQSMADIGATIADNFGVKMKIGKSILERIK